MEKCVKPVQKDEEKPKKRRSQAEKVGRRKYLIKKVKNLEKLLNRVDRRTRMLAAGLRGFLILGEDYVTMVACRDEVDITILHALRDAGPTGRQSGELADGLDINYRYISRRIQRMNRRMELEMGVPIIQKSGHKWVLISRLRRDFEDLREDRRLREVTEET